MDLADVDLTTSYSLSYLFLTNQSIFVKGLYTSYTLINDLKSHRSIMSNKRMFMKKTFYFVMINVFLLSFISSFVQADEVIVFRNESMPFCGTVENKDAGMVVDILNAVTEHGGPEFKFQPLPWKRAQLYVQTKKGTAIIPFTRTAVREKDYMWIVKLFSYELRLTAAKNPIRKITLPTPLSIDNAKNFDIGIILGSAHIPNLVELGFTNLKQVPSAEENIKKLLKGGVSAIIESQWVDIYHWKQLGMDPRELLIGPSIGKAQHIYLAAAVDFPADTADKIRKIMSQMRKNGEIEKILAKWR